jgi:hypothetical protein
VRGYSGGGNQQIASVGMRYRYQLVDDEDGRELLAEFIEMVF